MFKTVLSAAAIFAVGAISAKAEMPAQINFGIISTESASAQEKSFGPFLADMEKSLGVKVKSFFASDYAGVIEAMRFKKVDVAWFGNKSGIEAVDRAGGEVFTQTIKDNGEIGYYSLLITQKDSPLNSLADVLACDKSKTFGNGDPNSTSGFAVPGYYVWAVNGKNPEDCFKRVTSSNHEGNAMAVATGKVDVATNNTESLGRLEQNNPEAAKNIKVIWKSPLIPSDPMVWRADLDQDAKEKIYYFFMQYGRFGDLAKVKHERETLAQVSDGWGPFLASSNAQLISTRQIELFKKKLNADRADDKGAIAKADKALKALDEYKAIIGGGGY